MISWNRSSSISIIKHIQHTKPIQPTALNFLSKCPVPHLCHPRLSSLEGAVIRLLVVLLKWRYPIIQCLISLFWLLSSLWGTPQYKQFTYCTQKGANQGNYCFAAPICQLRVWHWLGWKCAIVCPVHAWTSSENNAMWITPGWYETYELKRITQNSSSILLIQLKTSRKFPPSQNLRVILNVTFSLCVITPCLSHCVVMQCLFWL